MDNLARMRSGRIYDPNAAELIAEQTAALEKLYDFNATRPSEGARRAELLREMLAAVGDDCYIEPPFHANWGGRNVHFGEGVYANFNLTLVDDTDIHVGDRVMFGPNVTVSTAGHPIQPALRERAAQFNLPVRIGRNVWIGAGALIMPGVEIGENSVIGAGSVVTRDIPANVVAVGTPCRVVREIGAHDDRFYWRDREVDVAIVDGRLAPVD
ncbi:sugar O-acetyltransferase [Microbacterium gilvum]|uniref:Acetyltransferase n=1 Tax=Microbacterium gilvum TaxID=1336204 RepID=A0ABP9A0K1_9MICO